MSRITSFRDGYLRVQDSREMKLVEWCDQFVKDKSWIEMGVDRHLYSVMLNDKSKETIVVDDEPKVAEHLLKSCGSKNVKVYDRKDENLFRLLLEKEISFIVLI